MIKGTLKISTINSDREMRKVIGLIWKNQYKKDVKDALNEVLIFCEKMKFQKIPVLNPLCPYGSAFQFGENYQIIMSYVFIDGMVSLFNGTIMDCRANKEMFTTPQYVAIQVIPRAKREIKAVRTIPKKRKPRFEDNEDETNNAYYDDQSQDYLQQY